MKSFAVLAAVLAVTAPAFAASSATSPYAGQEARPLKTLSAEDVRGYLAGEGFGMAKAGELNQYPGPKHELAMAEHLGLTPDQWRRIVAIAGTMTASAVPLGRRIVAAERSLDGSFARGTIEEPALRRMTETIGDLEGRLRAVHLTAHLATRRVLTSAQVAMYDRMRGYGTGAESMHHHHDS